MSVLGQFQMIDFLLILGYVLLLCACLWLLDIVDFTLLGVGYFYSYKCAWTLSWGAVKLLGNRLTLRSYF